MNDEDKQMLKRFFHEEVIPKSVIIGLILLFVLMSVSFR